MNRPSSALVRVGDILAGKYRVERMLGVGGMGVVVAATHLDLQEVFAIKLMHQEAAHRENSVERFLREARAAIRLRSEHVARVFDVGRLDNGSPYIVMEHLDGSDLRKVLQSRGALPIAEAAAHVIQACDALAEAHAAGIVHRDLKPANLFLTHRPDGSPCIKLLDFGISKITTPGTLAPGDMTRTTELLGSPLYMAPEQMRPLHPVDGRTDIWALGVILYRLLTNRLPFFAKGMLEICALVLERAPLPPGQHRPEIPPELESIVLRCLEKTPDRRFPDVQSLAAALRPFAEDAPPALAEDDRISVVFLEDPDEGAPTSIPAVANTAPNARAVPLWQPPPRRRRSLVASAAFALLGLVLGTAVTATGGAFVVRHAPLPAIDGPRAKPVLAAPAAGAAFVPAPALASDVAPAETCPIDAGLAEERAPEDQGAPSTPTPDAGTAPAAFRPCAPSCPRPLQHDSADPFGLGHAKDP
jgi:serine/threonine-protein kinase